jgi:hypothetical protein
MLGVLHSKALNFSAARELNVLASSTVWPLAISQRYACRNKGRISITAVRQSWRIRPQERR